MNKIVNPVLVGFHPDPSLIRVGDDYYMATSTFEWFPGVEIHHSRDLIHWRLTARALTESSQVNLRGNVASGSIWAPAISYDDGLFYLLFTDVKSRSRVYKDLHNYIICSKSIEGPWSQPVRLNGSGFDPFLFHDDDGRKWLLNMRWDFRKNHNNFSGIIMQEYDAKSQSLIGPIHEIYKGTPVGVTEGPQLYKRGAFYYLLTAEGGTGVQHMVTLARSRNLTGPYETDPHFPLMTTAHDPTYPLQQAGHGTLVETQHGEWYMAHLCTRPFSDTSLTNPLGRETAIQKCIWTEDGWLRLSHGGKLPALETEAPNLPSHPFPAEEPRDHFDREDIGFAYQSLRVPFDPSWVSLTDRPGFLRLRGRESLASLHDQSMVARPIQHFHCSVETCMEFKPESFYEMAGLVCYYDDGDYYYLRVTGDEIRGVTLGVILSKAGKYDEISTMQLSVVDWKQYYLKAVIHGRDLIFYASPDGQEWTAVCNPQDFGTLSDEYGGKLGFTGAFVGICVQDLDRQSKEAWFDYFEYLPLESLLDHTSPQKEK
ncbi:glycoside hydrolase family 43 protein [Paenibacillus polymyxa]|uniref:glycoside hydrolase family 43 protein n=1 Tax=Paenibacillus polymyxa TaxID=1406 RepID=UPI0002DE5ABB|nr:glycoside hydrolase family 43 protein [Paenibacillus polymyxa]MEE4563870.1 glycoside hydrolase family 43 protein [Paenibacillus polymyxa]NMP10291.1 glycoside hydrolase family 43 protein [Paenibacillus polymyxa]